MKNWRAHFLAVWPGVAFVIIGMLLGIMIPACTTNVANKDTEIKLQGSAVKEVIIESCVYFGFPTTHAYMVLTHKGNCPNPIHIYNREAQPGHGAK